jgi:cellulose synthase operon protein YhjQ
MEANTTKIVKQLQGNYGVPMDSRETGNESAAAGTPEDVAVLYSWANLHGAKYRDFSASRREYRAQIRYRAAQALRERELKAQAAAEASAAAAEHAALAAEAAARTQNSSDSQVLRVQALRSAEAAARKAAAERVEASRRADAAALAGVVAQREEREIAEAHASAQRQASSYLASEARRRQLAGPQPHGPLPGEVVDPYMPAYADSSVALDEDSEENMAGSRQFLHSGRYRTPAEPGDALPSAFSLPREPAPWQRPQGYRPDEPSGVWRIHQPAVATAVSEAQELLLVADAEREEASLGFARAFSPEMPLDPEPDRVTLGRALDRVASGVPFPSRPQAPPRPEPISDPDLEDERTGPAWLYSPQPPPPRTRTSQALLQSHGGDTLQDSRERVASRWFALKGMFEHGGAELPAMQPARPGETRAPLLLVFSLAGGVGKTSLVATLGRALSSQGEKVLLTDTTSHGLLPFYFGARELRPGVVRTFSAPAGSTDAPIYLVSYDVEVKGEDERQRGMLIDEIFRNARESNRVVLDLSAGASWLIRRMADLHPTVLVPVAPDMTSVISLQAVERFFQGIMDSDGRQLLPFYVLNQFDATLPLHLDVREVFRRQLGDRLLSFVIRRSPAVSEALAEGMTVVDYASEAPVSKDYFDIAAWLRGVSPPAAAGIRNARWGEG